MTIKDLKEKLDKLEQEIIQIENDLHEIKEQIESICLTAHLK